MKHRYRVTLRESSAHDPAPDGAVLDMTVESHDDLVEIAGKVAAKGLFDENEAKVFAVGLKMVTGVMLAHRNDPLFTDFAPQVGAFMKRLKAHGPPAPGA